MNYFLSHDAALKLLETPSVYHIKKDDLYELDEVSFEFLRKCSSDRGCCSQDNEFIDYCLNEGILTKNRIALTRPPVMKSPDPSLRYLELQITDKCNLRCKHCYIGDKDTSFSPFLNGNKRRLSKKNYSELSVSQIKNILKEFEEMQALRVLISGGEPLIHNKFNEINAMLPDFSIRKILFSNGLLLTTGRLNKLNVDEIQISIDGLETAHDSLRGEGTFQSGINAVLRAIDAGFEVSVSTMVHQKNLDDFDEMEKLFKEIGIKDWTVDVPCSTGRLADNSEFQISPEQGGKYLRYGYGEGLHAGSSGFACGLHLMAVMANGSVSRCTFYADAPVGRIDNGLRNSWKRIKPMRLSELKCDCEYIESCRGGCRYRAALLGDPSGKDFYRCNLYGVISKK